MAEQHGPVATYSCLAIEYVTTPPGSPVYRVGYTAPRFPRKAPGVVQIASPPRQSGAAASRGGGAVRVRGLTGLRPGRCQYRAGSARDPSECGSEQARHAVAYATVIGVLHGPS